MKTITQFIAAQLKQGKELLAKHRPADPMPSPPPEEKLAPEPASSPPEELPVAENAAATPAEAPANDGPKKANKVHAPAPEPSAEALAAVGAALSLDEKKVGLLVGALKVAGNRLERVRQVRVVESEGAPSAAVKSGDVAYIVDPLPELARKGRANDERGRRGGGDRNKDGGGRNKGGADKRPTRPGGGNPRGPNADKGGAGARPAPKSPGR